ncbi:hypothetical protein SDJN03_01981, partial [Cucurbita argyrosperma subsp. sororia]
MQGFLGTTELSLSSSPRTASLLLSHPQLRFILPIQTLHLTQPPSIGFDMKGGKSKTESMKPHAKLAVKKGAAKKGSKKAGKDPNKPKRPASAFFVFMEEFRKKFSEENPNNKAVSAVGKAAGHKWKSMSDAEKAPYVAKADKRKVEYEKNMKAYNKKQASGANAAEGDESEKSTSEVNGDDEAGDDDGSEEEEDEE